MHLPNTNPKTFPPMLACAPNATAKGQSQFFTPTDFGRSLALPLPRHRPVIVDLNCGAGHLLSAAANQTTQHALGSDIDPCRSHQPSSHSSSTFLINSFPGFKSEISNLKSHSDHRLPTTDLRFHRITADVTLLYSLLAEVDRRADLWVLNPPRNLHFWKAYPPARNPTPNRNPLDFPADSDLPSVRTAFAAHDSHAAHETGTSDSAIDSTIAMLLIALDRSTYSGEGLLIANNATLERLIFTPGAPHAALARHIWARVVVDGNPITGLQDSLASRRGEGRGEELFKTAIIYFARDHETGLRPTSDLRPPTPDPQTRHSVLSILHSQRDSLRQGARVIDPWQAWRDTVPLWSAVSSEWTARYAPTRTDYNLWLAADGEIKANTIPYRSLPR